MKRLLITGGSGFIGSNFVRRFLKTHPDWKITNLDLLSYCGNPENHKELDGNPRYEFIQGDIRNAAIVDSVISGSDGVIHFAAESHVDRSIDDPSAFLHTNILGTRVMLDAARKHKIPRFIQISTDEVYGSLAAGEAREDSNLLPNSPYSASKAAADLLVRAWRETYHFPAITVRSTNNYGPFQFPEKVIPLFVTNLLEGKKVPLYGSGENRRDWIYVEDNCRAIELVFDKGAPGEIYNIGGGNEKSNLELTDLILKIMGRGPDMIQKVADRPGHDFRYAVDTQKIRALGFKPQWAFEDGVKATIQWYKENESWWRPLKRDKFTVK